MSPNALGCRAVSCIASKGEMGSSIGAAFEVAVIVGLRLFEAEPATLTRHLSMERDKLTLLPQSVRTRTRKVKDDF